MARLTAVATAEVFSSPHGPVVGVKFIDTGGQPAPAEPIAPTVGLSRAVPDPYHIMPTAWTIIDTNGHYAGRVHRRIEGANRYAAGHHGQPAGQHPTLADATRAVLQNGSAAH
jgi:hypothetical protein